MKQRRGGIGGGGGLTDSGTLTPKGMTEILFVIGGASFSDTRFNNWLVAVK
jgi:hypothetical protein